MLWTDLALDRDIPNNRLREAWAAVFGIAPEEVAIVVDIAEENPWTDPRARIGLERRALPGEFPLQLMAILHGSDLEARVASRDGELATLRRLCNELGCRALVSTADIEPWEWLIVAPDGQTTVVELDEDALDTTGAVVVLEEAAVTTSG
ncbi:MAG: hypothetical protein ACRDJH_25775 [Thermomicrobiales bacterium]